MRAAPLLLVLALGGCGDPAACSVFGGGALGGGVFGSSGAFGKPSGGPAPVLLFDFAPGVSTTTVHQLPPCAAADLAAAGLPAGICAIQCTAHSSGAAWQCVDGTGAAYTVTAGTGAAVANVWGGSSQQVFSDANAPTITNANLGTLASVFASPHTTIWTGYGLNGGSIDFPFLITDGSNFEWMRDESGQTKCDWFNTAQTPTFVEALDNSGVTIDQGYSMVACRKAGTAASSVYTVRINGQSTSTSAWAHDPAVLGSSTLYFGRSSTSAHPINGEQESFTIYTAALSDAQLSTRQAAWDGVQPATSQSADPLAFNGHDTFALTADGQYAPMGAGTSRVTSAGWYVEEGNAENGVGNNCATDGLDVSSWTDVGTPTVATNVTSGMFFRWKNAAEVDELRDADAGTSDGKKCTTGLTAYVGHVTWSCYLAAGVTGTTTTKAQLVITTDGTGSTTCNVTGLTSTLTRFPCFTTIGGSPTTTKGSVLVGNAAADTGSIRIDSCQLDPEGWAQSPHPNHNGIGVDDLSSTANEVSTYSHTGESMEVIFTPDFTWANDEHALENEYTYEVMDIPNVARDDHRVNMWQYNYGLHAPSVANARRDLDDANISTYADSDPNMVAGHTYAFKVTWKSVGTDKSNRWIYFNECPGSVDTCTATTLIGSNTTGTQFRPTDDTWGGMQIGCRFNRILCFDGLIKRARVWTAP